MKFNKKLFLTLTLAFPLAAGLLAHANMPTPEDIYRNLQGELSVEFMSEGGPLVGTSVRQMNNPAGHPSFCRRTSAVVPNPTYTYECFYQTLTGNDAEVLYTGSHSLEFLAIFRSVANGGVLDGSSWKEKYIGRSDATICVKTEPVVPDPLATYTCYSNWGGDGGAVSGGN